MELQKFLLQLRYLLLLFADLLLQFGQLFFLLVDERAPLFRLLRQPPGLDFDRLKLFSSHFEKKLPLGKFPVDLNETQTNR